MRRFLHAFVKREALLIGAFIIVALALLTVIHLGSEIHADGPLGIDRWLLLALRHGGDLGRPIGPAWLRPVFVDITALGGVTALTLLTIAVSGYLLAAKRHRTAMLIVAATISGAVMGQILKFAFGRGRPTLVPHFVEIDTLSYPSGHAVNSAVVFLTLAALLARAEQGRAARVYIVVVAILFTILIGFSRVYVGVHWPSDVLAGWAIGGSWAMLWWAIAVRLERGA